MSHLYIIMKLIDGIFKSFLFELLTNIVYKPRETDQKSNKEKVFSQEINQFSLSHWQMRNVTR